MPKVNQLTVRCENRPGTLAHIAKVMGDANVNILGFHLSTSGTKGHVKLIVDDVEKAKETLEKAGLFLRRARCSSRQTAERAGSARTLCRKASSEKDQHPFGISDHREGFEESQRRVEVSNLDQALRVSQSTVSDRLYE